jgi:hypothetical protein
VIEKSVDRRFELIAALEKVDFENEEVAHQISAEFFDKIASCLCRPACIRLVCYLG